MNKIIIFLLLTVAVACTGGSEINDGDMVPLLAPSAKIEPFDDGSGLVKVTIYGSDQGILEQGYYLNGYREGVYTKFHTNGYVNVVTGYVHGKMEGQSVVADDRGQILERFTYHNDLLHGSYIKFNRTRLKEKKEYVKGAVEGIVELYYPNGKIMERSNYTNGTRNGISQWFDQEGNLSIEYSYNNGELVQETSSPKESSEK